MRVIVQFKRTHSSMVISSAQAATSRSCNPTSKRRLKPLAVRSPANGGPLDPLDRPHDHASTESAFPLPPREPSANASFSLPMLGDAQRPVELIAKHTDTSKDFTAYGICFRTIEARGNVNLYPCVASRVLSVNRSRAFTACSDAPYTRIEYPGRCQRNTIASPT